MVATSNKVLKRIFGVDKLSYRLGVHKSKTKELLELVASVE